MSVIITGMDMPESCANCSICHCKGKDKPWNYYCAETMDDINIEEWDRERYITCPLKSIDGLIEKIEQLKKSCANDSYGKCMTNVIFRVEILIKEYCEVSE